MNIWSILIGVLLAAGVYMAIMYFYQKKIITTLNQTQFIQGYRKAQIIDIRDQDEFNAGHILGARNIPVSQISQRAREVRKDTPVYLYDQGGFNTIRAAQILRKNGVKDIYQLEGGFKNWSGKVKRK